MSRIVDFHTHILPGIDDGSASVQESIGMLRMEAEQGIRCVVATPHFNANNDTPERFLSRRQEAANRLRESISRQEEMPEIILGAEVYFFHGISDCEALSGLTIGENGYILIEMPASPWTRSMYAELEEVRAKWGIIPIIAHVDRYLGVFNTHGIPEQLEKMPVLVQANAGFFLRGSSRARALRMLERDQIQLLGSDCHNLTTRQPNLEKALRVIAGHLPSDTTERIEFYQEQVLAGIHHL